MRNDNYSSSEYPFFPSLSPCEKTSGFVSKFLNLVPFGTDPFPIRLMAEIDEVIETHGGWPGAFSLSTAKGEK